MADKTTLLLVVGGLGVAWYEGWLAPLGIPAPSFAASAATPVTPTTPTIPTTPTPTSPTTPGAPATPSANTPPPAPAQKYPPLSAVKSLTLVLANADQAAHVATCGDQPPATQMIAGFPVPNPDYVTWLSCRGSVQPMMTPDDWNVYLVRAGGPNPAPDPLVVFPGVDRTQPMSFDQYWPSMAAYLGAQLGMAGYRRRLR